MFRIIIRYAKELCTNTITTSDFLEKVSRANLTARS